MVAISGSIGSGDCKELMGILYSWRLLATAESRLQMLQGRTRSGASDFHGKAAIRAGKFASENRENSFHR
jgi:hypothetical protein